MIGQCVAGLRAILAIAILTIAGTAIPAKAREIVVIHERPPHYRPVVIMRHRHFRGIPVIRIHGPLYPGFGFFYRDAEAWRYFGFTAWQLAIFSALDEYQLRAHEAAIVDATTAPLNESVTWHDGRATGSVTAVREGRTPDGRTCREFEQTVSVADRTEQARGAACLQPNGSWRMNTDDAIG